MLSTSGYCLAAFKKIPARKVLLIVLILGAIVAINTATYDPEAAAHLSKNSMASARADNR